MAGGTLVGFGWLVEDPVDPRILEAEVVVTECERGKGIGKAILDCLLAEAGDEDGLHVRGVVQKTNPSRRAAINLLRACGFVEEDIAHGEEPRPVDQIIAEDRNHSLVCDVRK
jgi:ribosomal protein S18 acetylase RimI-like enzyme